MVLAISTSGRETPFLSPDNPALQTLRNLRGLQEEVQRLSTLILTNHPGATPLFSEATRVVDCAVRAASWAARACNAYAQSVHCVEKRDDKIGESAAKEAEEAHQLVQEIGATADLIFNENKWLILGRFFAKESPSLPEIDKSIQKIMRIAAAKIVLCGHESVPLRSSVAFAFSARDARENLRESVETLESRGKAELREEISKPSWTEAEKRALDASFLDTRALTMFQQALNTSTDEEKARRQWFRTFGDIGFRLTLSKRALNLSRGVRIGSIRTSEVDKTFDQVVLDLKTLIWLFSEGLAGTPQLISAHRARKTDSTKAVQTIVNLVRRIFEQLSASVVMYA